MSEPLSIEQEEKETMASLGPYSRAVGSPLSMGSTPRSHIHMPEDSDPISRFVPHQPPPPQPHAQQPSQPSAARALGTGKPAEEPSTLQRAMSMLRAVMPVVQRILPLLDGNIGTAVANLIAPQPHPQQQQPAPPPPPKVDLVPLEKGLAELQTQYRSLGDQVMEQNTSLKRVEDQLEMVREATDRNTLEQQELLEDLKAFSNKVKVVAWVGFGLLAVIIAINVIVYLHLRRVLP
jgi:hypothetical protein